MDETCWRRVPRGTYVPDNENNLTSRTCAGSTTTFRWAGEGVLDSVNVAGVGVHYDYDALGRLVRGKAGVVVRFYLWDGDHLLAEVDSAASPTIVGEYSYYGTDQLQAELVGRVQALRASESVREHVGADGLDAGDEADVWI